MTNAVESAEVPSFPNEQNREVPNPRERRTRGGEGTPLILIDDENGRRPNPVEGHPQSHTSTDHAAGEPHTGTVTDGEDG